MYEGRRKNIIHLIFEADVTVLRQSLTQRNEAANGRRVSLTTCIAHTLAAAVDEDRSMHAYRQGKKQLVLFDDIDLAVMVERDVAHGTLPVVHIVRAANRKTLDAIQGELKTAKVSPLGEHGPMSALEKRFFELPTPLRRLVWFFIRRDPYAFKQLAGTVGITSMGMHARGVAVVQPITPMTLTLSIGSIGKKMIMEEGCPVERETIQLNLSADHDIIDGAPLVRFADRLSKKIEQACVLDPPQATD
jgi:pyruvate/2-oxoglutarate dehydrogenase complex dihydrolipoamide acyltransferase (E2) component